MVFQVLLIKRVQQCVTGTVSRRRSACRLLAAEVFRLTAKRTLIDTTIIKTRERQAHVFEFQNRFRPGFTHIFNRVLVTDIVRPFYGVVHMPFPVIFMGITQRNGNAALRRNGMGTGREDFREQRTGLAALGNLQRRAHTCATAPITTASNSLTGNFITHPTPQRIHKSRKPPVQRQSPVAASGAMPAV